MGIYFIIEDKTDIEVDVHMIWTNSQDMLRTFSNSFLNQINVVDTLSVKQTRPTTTSTARNAIERFVKQIRTGEYNDKKNKVWFT